MPFAISDKVRNRLVGRVRQALDTLEVRQGVGAWPSKQLMELDDENSGALAALPKAHQDVALAALGNVPLWTLIGAMVSEAVEAHLAELSPLESRSLADILSADQREQLAASLVAELTALPRPYVYSFGMSRKFTAGYRAAELPPVRRERIILEGAWQSAEGSPPIVHSRPNGRGHQTGFWTLADITRPHEAVPEERVRLHIAADGFVTPHESAETSATARQTLRAFIGLGLSLKLLERDFVADSTDTFAPIHRRNGVLFELAHAIDLTGREAQAVRALRLPEPLVARDEIWKGLDDLAVLFSSAVGAHIKLAGKWLFDYFTESDSAMRVMHVAIATEVLLGSSGGEDGITKTLATRLAYLIAQTHSERKALEVEFKELYQMRSKVVHNGHQRLSRKEGRALRRFGELAGRVVATEMKLVLADLR